MSTAEPARLKSTPDTAKIAPMSDPRLVVMKRFKGAGNDRLVVNGVKIENPDHVYRLMEEVKTKEGSGSYTFLVTDNETGEKDQWACILGNDDQEGFASDMGPTAAGPLNGGGSAPGTPMNLGNGFVLTLFPHDPTKGLLTTPQRTAIEWREGMPLPGMPGFTTFGAAGASPVQAPLSMPTADPMSPLMDIIRGDREARKEQEMKSEFRTMLEQVTARQDALIERLSAKPAGPSPELELMKAQLAATEKRLEEERRERENTRREDSFKAEMMAMNNRLEAAMREMGSNKPDPAASMASLFTQIMTSQQGSTTAMLSAIERAATVQAAAHQESARQMADRIMPPEKIMEILTLAKDKGPEHAVLLDGMQRMMGMWGEIMKMRSDLEPQGEPAWVGMIRQGIDQLGTLGTAYMSRPPQQQAPVFRPRPVVVPRPAQAAEPIVTPAPPAAAIPLRTGEAGAADAAREAAAARVFREGAPGKPDDLNADARTVAVAPDAVFPPGVSAAAVSQVYQQLAQASPDAVRELVREEPDAVFFGAIVVKINELRTAVAADQMDANQIADVVLQGQAALQAMKQFPTAMELLKVGQFLVLVERLLPDEDDDFVEEVVEALRKKTQG